MARLFVAVDLPSDHVAAFRTLHDPNLQARWTLPDQYHVTLRFLGDVDEHRIEQLKAGLEDIDLPSFQLGGEGLDVFPSKRKPRVLVAHVNEAPGLMALQVSVDDLAVKMGFDEDPKPFNPHVTLGRLKKATPREVRSFLKRHADFSIDPFVATEFRLYESNLGSDGSVHTVLREYGLRQAWAAREFGL